MNIPFEPFEIDPAKTCKLAPEEIRSIESGIERFRKRGWSGLDRLPEDPFKLPPTHELVRIGDAVTLLYGDSRGQQGVLNHIEDPTGKARDWWRQRNREACDLCLFHGLGLGHLNESILETARSGTRFFIAESDPHTFALWLASPFAEEMIDHPRITLVLTESPEEAARRTGEWFVQSGLPSPRIRILANHAAFFPCPEFVRDWLDALARRFPSMAEPVSREIFNLYPRPQNLWENWSVLSSRPGVSGLFGRLEKVPIAVVGAGPSLESLKPILREHQDRLLIIACDTAVRPLIASGVRVDVAVAMDSTEKNHAHLRGLTKEDFLPVFHGGANPALLQEFRSKFWAAGASPFPTSALIEHLPGPARQLQAKGELILNGSVGTSALDLAVQLGGDPLFLAGIDLAYAEGRDHVSGTIYDADSDFQNRQPPRYAVPDVRGRWVGTCTPFLISLYGMKHQIGLADAQVFNLSPIGAAIPGALSPEESLAELKSLPKPSGESPAARLRAEAGLAERSLARPLWRYSLARPNIAKFFDSRGKWLTSPGIEARFEAARINLEVLGETDPGTASLLASDPESLKEGRFPSGDACQWGKTEEGYPLLTFRDFQGNEIARFPQSPSPWAEISERADERLPDLPFLPILGAGLGFFLQSIFNRIKETPIVVWEPNVDRMRVALGGANWTDLFAEPRLLWRIGYSAEDLLRGLEQGGLLNARDFPVYYRPWVHPGLEKWGQKDIARFHTAWTACYRGELG